ncbi:MAG: response regulator transcription factor [Myxococcota bacterium]
MTGSQVHILVVEDDAHLRATLEDNLRADGYHVTAVPDGAGAQQCWNSQPLDVIILDIMLPDTDGYRLCRMLREQGVGARVLMLTARTLEDDVVQGFNAGADDYLQKPYRLRELLARVRALSRRAPVAATQVLRLPGFALDPGARVLRGDGGAQVDLTRTEFDVLQCLLRNHDRALSRDELLREVWGAVHVEERTVDNFISSIKKKLGWSPQSAWRIRTVRGYGYRLEVDGRVEP